MSNHQKIIKLTHYYSGVFKHDFFGIKTDWSIEDVNLACGYIQLIRDALPTLLYGDDIVGEDDGIEMLHAFYGFERIYTKTEYDYVIDFHDNWEEYTRVPNEKLNQFALGDPRETCSS